MRDGVSTRSDMRLSINMYLTPSEDDIDSDHRGGIDAVQQAFLFGEVGILVRHWFEIDLDDASGIANGVPGATGRRR
jgi:hypothetical protein